MLQTGIPNFSGFRTVVSEHNVQYGQMRYQTIDLIEFHENKLYQKLSEALVRYYDTDSGPTDSGPSKINNVLISGER